MDEKARLARRSVDYLQGGLSEMVGWLDGWLALTGGLVGWLTDLLAVCAG